MSSSPPSSTALRTPQSDSVALPPTRSGRQRKQVEKFGSMMDSDLIVDHLSDYSADEGKWDEETEEDTDEEQSFSKGVKEAEEDDDDAEMGEDEDEDDEDNKKSKRSKKSKSTPSASKASRSSISKGKKEAVVKSSSTNKKKTTSKPALLPPKSAAKKKAKRVETEDEESGSEAESITVKSKSSAKSKVQVKTATTKKVSVPSKRVHSPAGSEAETVTGDKEDKDEEPISAPNSPSPSKKAKVAPLTSAKSTLSFPKVASKPATLIKPKAGATTTTKSAQPVKPVVKGRGGGLLLAKKTDSLVSITKFAPATKAIPKKEATKVVKEPIKKAAAAKKVKEVVQEEEVTEDEEKEMVEKAKPEPEAEMADVEMEEQEEEQAASDEEEEAVSKSDAKAKTPRSRKAPVSTKGKGKRAAGADESEEETGDEDVAEDVPVKKSSKVGSKTGPTQDLDGDQLSDDDAQPQTPVVSPKKGKKVAPVSSDSNPAGSPSKPVDKVTPAIQCAIINALKSPPYLKSVDFKSAAKPFGDECDHTKLSRHWNQVLSVDLLGVFGGTPTKKSAKSSAKGALGEKHRLAIWEAVLAMHNKVDWEGLANVSGGMGGDKLKRHLKQVMDKQVRKFIAGA